MSLNKEMKKVLLAGIGAATFTVEHAKAAVDALVKKGTLTMEQGKVLNEELKHRVKEVTKPSPMCGVCPKDEGKSVLDQVQSMTPEEIAVLKAKLEEMEKQARPQGTDSEA